MLKQDSAPCHRGEAFNSIDSLFLLQKYFYQECIQVIPEGGGLAKMALGRHMSHRPHVLHPATNKTKQNNLEPQRKIIKNHQVLPNQSEVELLFIQIVIIMKALGTYCSFTFL